MAHPPYAWWDYALDVGWVFNFSAAGVVAVVRWGWGGVLWAGLLAALVVSRFVFPHTMGLSLICVELPLSVALLIRSARLLVMGFPMLVDADAADR